ncbi:hypothetical protein CEXT_240391 [Caerostris extrusa]|uniref:Uncharacterized protein n=1 Tax=Caerostris extrusa TaxID=172846 RepID=A0AAV4XJ68_CAEEX|nr:hypothetical protein CEXT_240391 [Caerostris extrusa]
MVHESSTQHHLEIPRRWLRNFRKIDCRTNYAISYSSDFAELMLTWPAESFVAKEFIVFLEFRLLKASNGTKRHADT